MTWSAADSGEHEADFGNADHGMRWPAQLAIESMSPFARPLGMSNVQALHQELAGPTLASTLADVAKPFGDGKVIAAALGIGNIKSFADGKLVAATLGASAFFENNVDWPQTMGGNSIATALLSGLHGHLVDGAASGTLTAASRVGSAAPRRFVAAATLLAKKATTIAELGDALRALRQEVGMSLNGLVAYVEEMNQQHAANIVGLSKTALSNACQGHQLFQTEQQVIHFVAACRAKPDVEVWIAAWRRAKKNRGARPRGSGIDAHPASAVAPAEARNGWWLSGPDDEVLQVIRIPVTRGQVRAVVVATALLGLIASSTSTPAVRAAGLAAIGVAAGVALVDQTRARHGSDQKLHPPAA